MATLTVPTPAAAAASAPPRPCRNIVFDMDGVLLDSEPVYLAVEGKLVRSLAGPDADLRALLPRLLGRTSRDSAAICIEHFALDMSVAEFLRVREEALLPAFADVPLLPGVEEFVRAMKKSGVRMAVATSSPAGLLAAKRAGKEEFFALFEGIVCGDDVAQGKPSPEIFLKAAAIIDADPGDCLVFEDAPAGVIGAKAAGMRCVAFPNEDVEMRLYEEAGFDLACRGFLDFRPESMGLPPYEDS